ncbi:SDR family oxidoreductase [Rhodopila sp.]|uniref:SDR family oxidoreductase n=1 Tax=Rhodopila sp. TaxID=2480087 RepID=UPI003D108311
MSRLAYERIGRPNDSAQAAVSLASDSAIDVTGATPFVDGGMTLYRGFAPGD